MNEPMKENVRVWDESYEITVYQKSKAVWIAVGEYLGQEIRTKAQTRGAAISGWREAARYKGN
jgi:hypothetical protein